MVNVILVFRSAYLCIATYQALQKSILDVNYTGHTLYGVILKGVLFFLNSPPACLDIKKFHINYFLE